LTFILFMEQVYFWLSVMLKLKLAANFNMTTKNYFVVDCIHNIIFIDLFFWWMDGQEHFHLFYMYMHRLEIMSQFTCFYFFFYLLIINELSLTKESSIIWIEGPFKMLPQNLSMLYGNNLISMFIPNTCSHWPQVTKRPKTKPCKV